MTKYESPSPAAVVLETLFGPAFLGYSQSLNDGGGRFYIAVGPSCADRSPNSAARPDAMTFSRKILVGLAAGIATGLVLGELVAPLQIVADGFVRLLQMTVLPYVTISIIASLGSLNLQQARLLGLRGGLVVLGLWAIAFAVTWLMPLTWPATETASFFSTTLVERRPPFDFVALYIPVQSVQRARQQRRARRRALLGDRRHRADRRRAERDASSKCCARPRQ